MQFPDILQSLSTPFTFPIRDAPKCVELAIVFQKSLKVR